MKLTSEYEKLQRGTKSVCHRFCWVKSTSMKLNLTCGTGVLLYLLRWLHSKIIFYNRFLNVFFCNFLRYRNTVSVFMWFICSVKYKTFLSFLKWLEAFLFYFLLLLWKEDTLIYIVIFFCRLNFVYSLNLCTSLHSLSDDATCLLVPFVTVTLQVSIYYI